MAAERERTDVREARETWIAQRQARMRAEPARLVFVDETAVTTKMVRLRGRALRGKRLPGARTVRPLEHADLYRWLALR